MSVEHKNVFSCVLLLWDSQNCFVQCCMHVSTHATILCSNWITFFNSAASMNPFPSLVRNRSNLWELQRERRTQLSNIWNFKYLENFREELTCQIFWKPLSVPQSCPGVLPETVVSDCNWPRFFLTFPHSPYSLNLFPHHLHKLVKVKFPVSVHVVLNDKAENLQIDQRRKSADQPT